MSVTSSHAFRRSEKWHASLRHTLTLRSYSWIRFATLSLVTPNRGTPFFLMFLCSSRRVKTLKVFLKRSVKAQQPFVKNG